MLKVENVTSGYVEGIDILTDVSLEIKEGIITGMIGPNGAGKSTLLKAIFAFLQPTAGKNSVRRSRDSKYSPLPIEMDGDELCTPRIQHLSPTHCGR